MTRLWLFSVLFFLSFAQSCNFKPYGQGPLVDHKTFVSCLEGVLFNESSAMRTIDTLRKTVPLYAFRDIVKNSPKNGFPQFKLDLLADLDRVNKTRYDSDADFHQDLADMFLRLRDPHTYYQKPKECYSVFALQPLVFGSQLVGDRQIITVSGVLGKLALDPLYKNIPLMDFLGAEVTFIDEQPALDEIIEFARLYGYISKDDGSSFNWAVSSGYQQRPLALLPIPLGPSQHIEFAYANGTFGSYHIPWGFFFTTNIHYTPYGCSAMMLKAQQKPQSVLEEWALPINTLNSLGMTPKLQGPPDISIKRVDSQTIVLQITTFVPEDNDRFLAVVDKVVEIGLKENIPNLILDVRGNGGGDICLGYEVIHSLIAERNPIGHYDIIHSPLMDLLVSSSRSDTPLVGSEWWTDENGQPFQNNSWYNPGVQHLRGGINGAYSAPSYHNCNFSTDRPDYLFKKILILSDGLCGSTCAVFTSHLNEIARVDTAVIGGIWNQPQQPFSFPGGQVLDYVNLVDLARYLGLSNHPLVPKKFPNAAGFRFTWLEIYPWLQSDPTNLPLEFFFIPADYRIPVWLSSSASDAQVNALYQAAAKLFNNM